MRQTDHGFGVFTREVIVKGGFVGLYCYETCYETDSYHQKGTHMIESSHGIIGVEVNNGEMTLQQANKYMMAAVNEPTKGPANCFFADIATKHYGYMGVFAARKIHPGEELTVHYGTEYRRDYTVGTRPNTNGVAREPAEEYLTHWPSNGYWLFESIEWIAVQHAKAPPCNCGMCAPCVRKQNGGLADIVCEEKRPSKRKPPSTRLGSGAKRKRLDRSMHCSRTQRQ